MLKPSDATERDLISNLGRLSAWFSSSINPHQPGLYRAQATFTPDDCFFPAFWDGWRWTINGITCRQVYRWRGLDAFEQKFRAAIMKLIENGSMK